MPRTLVATLKPLGVGGWGLVQPCCGPYQSVAYTSDGAASVASAFGAVAIAKWFSSNMTKFVGKASASVGCADGLRWFSDDWVCKGPLPKAVGCDS